MTAKRLLLVSVDTEEEGNWSSEGHVLRGGPKQTVKNIQALPRLHEVLDPLGVKPIYLMDYPVVNTPRAAETIGELYASGRCEIGSHLHPWVNPPYDDLAESRPGATYAHTLPRELERAKLHVLTDKIEEVFGHRPVVYRGGRYSFDRESLELLEELNYTVDTSVTPMALFQDPGAPDFLGAPHRPYYLDRQDVRRAGDSTLLEVPVTIDALRPLPAVLARRLLRTPASFRLGGVMNRTGLVTWFRPSRARPSAMKRLIRRWERRENPVLNMMFHSSELLAGASPYTPTEASVVRFLEKIDATLSYAISRGWQPCLYEDLPAHFPRTSP